MHGHALAELQTGVGRSRRRKDTLGQSYRLRRFGVVRRGDSRIAAAAAAGAAAAAAAAPRQQRLLGEEAHKRATRNHLGMAVVHALARGIEGRLS